MRTDLTEEHIKYAITMDKYNTPSFLGLYSAVQKSQASITYGKTFKTIDAITTFALTAAISFISLIAHSIFTILATPFAIAHKDSRSFTKTNFFKAIIDAQALVISFVGLFFSKKAVELSEHLFQDYRDDLTQGAPAAAIAGLESAPQAQWLFLRSLATGEITSMDDDEGTADLPYLPTAPTGGF